jgi:hypothetical protein
MSLLIGKPPNQFNRGAALAVASHPRRGRSQQLDELAVSR